MIMDKTFIYSVADFLAEIPKLRNQLNKGSLYYRGESKAFPQVCCPTLYRKDEWAKRERYFHNELLHRFPESVRGLDLDLERMVLMQHYGFPTRLLDVSESPLVALYFAVENEDFDGEDYEDGFVHCIKVPYEGIHYAQNDEVKKIAKLVRKDNDFLLEPPDDYRKILFVKPPWKNDRIRAQQGQMIIFGCDGHKLNPVYLSKEAQTNAPYLHCTWQIPAECKKPIRKELYDLGIHEWTLFPDIEHLANELKRKKVRRALDQ